MSKLTFGVKEKCQNCDTNIYKTDTCGTGIPNLFRRLLY